MKLVVYLDLLLGVNLMMNYLLLWAAAKLSDLKYKIWRLLLVSLLGTCYTILVILPQFSFLNRIFIHIIISMLMILGSFAPLKVKKFFKVVGYFYLITFATAGGILALYNLTGGSPLNSLAGILSISPDNLWLIIFASLFIIIIGQFGWIFIQQKILPNIFCLGIEITFGEQVEELVALVDTGNHLQDPLTKIPVIVVELEALADLLPVEVIKLLESAEADQSLLFEQDIETSWAKRFRLIPFSSLGAENGMLIGFRPDEILIKTKEEELSTDRAIIALKKGKLNQNDDYQALLNPELFKMSGT
ncbi:sigma-E processing peptidase SpoIIGA [Halanaerobacter jeridensis]|uniref:Sporulation sigma-E factor-processing peptidase n=1 Tax=Halanaerobacter jeridensis TaxID=706427 RepID=A0A938XUS3_9FIRM|nr:sigma-E processing peptidase SpoIIGA [Halanaerobacter jeridensis]MBM7557928.1 stage II sporulation protein GA (sporulation sigma-E factor processing peptidase) [Halanaerobacter jeridensis]